MKTNGFTVSTKRVITLAVCLVLMAGCRQNNVKPQTIRICDDYGCADRPDDSASYDPAITDPNDGLADHIPELEELAATSPKAAFDLGLRYFRGDGIRKNSYQAIQWMRNAAERGNFEAQKALGRFYLTGLEEMGEDPAEAEKWLMLAAGRGDKEAKKLLKEAIAAKKNRETYVEWSNYWRPIFHGGWSRGYSYNHYWRNNRWY